ncbi:MAG TPA: aspartyl/asparaginyl beta-hydroxylase domain-containing protein [Allosphingosinicella sp.]|nr:aspartyl/asparaginyl beta-hydroxylase domain-containing protein [Allosphingosinicella sp.]
MRLSKPLLRLPIRFDPEALAEEVRALPATAWDPHPTGFVGNEAVRLVTPHGALTDAVEGPMAPTIHLLRCPRIMGAMAEIGGVWGRSRLMALAPGAEVPAHVDAHYYWRTHWRIHIPVVTNPGVSFTCGGDSVHMAPGECWVFDSFRWHDVQNRGGDRRVHLVLDTVGGERFAELLAAAESGAAPPPNPVSKASPDASALAFERVNSPTIMSPWEMRCHVGFIAEEAVPDALLPAVMKRIERLIDAWAALWARFGEDQAGVAAYRALIASARRDLVQMGGARLLLRNELQLLLVLDQLVFQMALAPPAPSPGDRLAS